MANEPDDLDPGPVPEPDAEPTPAEKARARAFGEIVDKVIAGRPPAAMSAEDRALVEVATVIRSVCRAPDGARGNPIELPEKKLSTLIESALRGAVDGVGRGRGTVPDIVGAEDWRRGSVPVVPPEARSRWAQRAPWMVAGASTLVAAAAVIAMWMRPAPRAPAAPPAPVASQPRLRTPDELVGSIPRDKAGDAVSRIDILFADRLDGYRTRVLGGQ